MAEATDENPIGDGFETLNAQDQKETKAIIDEINKDHAADVEPEPKPKEEPAPKKEEKSKAEEEKKPEEAKKPEEEQSRKSKMVPAWVLKAKEAAHQKELDKLQSELSAARTNAPKEKKEAEPDDQPEVDTDLRKKTDAIAQKYGTDPDEEYDRALAARVDAQVSKVEIPKELSEKISRVDKLLEDDETRSEENRFKDDFDTKVIPLIKSEYGNDVPQSTIDSLRDKVKEKAYTETYEKVPLDEIYFGGREFRGVIPKKDGGSQPSRGGHQAAHEAATEGDDVDVSGRVALTEAQVMTLTDEQFDKYSEGRATWERSSKK